MSAFGGKADMPIVPAKCPLLTQSGHATTRFHQSNCWISRRVAAHGASAAAGPDATHRGANGLAGEQFGIPVTTRIVCAGAAKIGLGGGPQFADRHSLV